MHAVIKIRLTDNKRKGKLNEQESVEKRMSEDRKRTILFINATARKNGCAENGQERKKNDDR